MSAVFADLTVRGLAQLDEPVVLTVDASHASAILAGVRASEHCAFWTDTLSYADVDLSGVVGHRGGCTSRA